MASNRSPLIAAALALGLSGLLAGCCSDRPPPPITREELVGVWVAPGYHAGLWRLVLCADGTGTLSYATLEEGNGYRRTYVLPVTAVSFDEAKGSAVITSEVPGSREVFRVYGYRGAEQLWGTSEERPGGTRGEVRFVREAPMLDALRETAREPR
jgi:hypothetical protein